ncbi:hypothetical protein ABPG72_018702 [Tetrahymena utriculariae]
MAVSIRYLNSEYQIVEQFLTLQELNYQNANEYYNKLKAFLEEYDLMKKLMFISTDGAYVVSSTKNGLVGKLKSNIPYLISTKCAAHKICLGVKDLSNQFHDIKILNEQVYLLCAYFNTKKKLDLLAKNQYKLLKGDDHSILTLLQPTDVRWISYYPSVVRIVDLLFPVLDTLNEIMTENQSFTLQNLINHFQQLENIILIAMYGDLLSPIYKLTKQIQKQDVTLMELQEDFQQCKLCLLDLKEKEGPLMRTLIQRIGQFDNEHQIIYFDNKQHYLKSSYNYGHYFFKNKNKQQQMIDFLIITLNERFDYFTEIKDFQAFNITQIIKLKPSEIESYGTTELKNTLSFYKQNQQSDFCQKEEVLMEQYQLSKRRIQSCPSNMAISDILKLISQSIFLKDISIFYQLFQLIPISSVECERIFSHVTNILSKKRNQLDTQTINDLLFISRNGPEIENIQKFDINKAIEYWKNDKLRRFV